MQNFALKWGNVTFLQILRALVLVKNPFTVYIKKVIYSKATPSKVCFCWDEEM